MTRAPERDCSLSCHGNPAVSCGAFSRINVYSATVSLSAATGPGIATTPSTTTASSSRSPINQAPSPPSSNAVTLSKGAVAGIGVGSALGAALICTIVFYLWYHRRRQKSSQVSSAEQGPPMLEYRGPSELGGEAVTGKQISGDASRIRVELGDHN